MAKVLYVLHDDAVDGYPPAYARDDVPEIAAETDLVHPIVRALHDELRTHDIDGELARRRRAAPGHEWSIVGWTAGDAARCVHLAERCLLLAAGARRR